MAAIVPFPNFMQMQPRVPVRVWQALRVGSVLSVVALVVTLLVVPRLGLTIFWGFTVPLLPLIFLVAPGFWRNVCPLAATNQIPRLFGFTKGLTLPPRAREYAYVAGIALLIAIVPSRKVLFNFDGPALALLILLFLGGAFVGGLAFKGKSGWCSSICPLLPVQRLYGQTPFLLVRNSHCAPCVGCAKNCYDFNPGVAYLADLHDERHYSAYRKFFAGAFPGLIVAFYTLPDPAGVAELPDFYLRFALLVLASVGVFFFLDSFVKVTTNKITGLFAVLALNLYYLFNVPLLADRVGALLQVEVPTLVVYALQIGLLELTLLWLWRTYAKEPLFYTQAVAPRPPRIAAGGRSLGRHRAAQADHPEVTFQPSGKRVVARPGLTLLEVAEADGQKLESGCRMGMCGADPVAILEGMDNLSPVGADERGTLERLGLAENTRMACCARVQGGISLKLQPDRPTVPMTSSIMGFKYDRAVQRVVILGHGVAGATAADHVRRRHPTCEIHLVGSESHRLYNRMAISRLIYGRSAMQGLYLLNDEWYEERQVTSWLNTRAIRIDRANSQVLLGTGEWLPYDRLILATGSGSAIAQIEGFGRPGSFVLREAEDAMRIRAYAQEHGCRNAVISGGGLLGLEAAYALLKLGLQVTVLERGEWLLRRQLDRRGAELVKEYLDGLGIHVVTLAETAALEGDDQIDTLELKEGGRLPCDLFLLCAGIAPNVGLAREAGLEVKRGVLVDECMRTSDPRVFAAGDVAEVQGQVLGLWPAAVDQATIAAINAVGGAKEYQGTLAVTILKVVGVELTSLGQFDPKGPTEVVIALEDVARHRYRKLVLAEGRAVGAILLGYPELTQGVQAAIKDGRDLVPHLAALRAGDWDTLG